MVDMQQLSVKGRGVHENAFLLGDGVDR
jgi:hypothetical protein